MHLKNEKGCKIMNEELKNYAKRKVHFLLVAWIVILIINLILILIIFNCEYNNLSTSISLMTPTLIIFYGIIWWQNVYIEFLKNEQNKRN